jgi:hypothetical protein
MLLNSAELVTYLLDERRRRIFNWRAIENLAGIGNGRIKNVCLYDKGQFREAEIEALNVVLSFLK